MYVIKQDRNHTDYLAKYGLYIFFLLMAIAFSLLTPKFYAPDNILNILMQSAFIGIAVVGMVFVLLTAGIDLSVGTSMLFSGTLVAFCVSKGLGLFGAVMVAISSGAIIGSINGLVISRWRVVPFIATLASATFMKGITFVFTGATSTFFNGAVSDFITKSRIAGIPLIVGVLIAAVLIGQFVLMKTSFGRQIYAIGNNWAVAEKIGIHVKRKIFMVYLISGIMAGISGMIAAAQVGIITPTMGSGQEFVVISSAVLGGVSLFGGKGNIFPGAIMGVIIIVSIENILVLIHADLYLYTIVRGVVIFMAVMIDCLKHQGELR